MYRRGSELGNKEPEPRTHLRALWDFRLDYLGLAYEQSGQPARARAQFQHAYDLATAHNPPAAYARPHARKKLGLPSL